MANLDQLSQAIQAGQADCAAALTRQATDASVAPKEILDCMVEAMDEVGRRFQCGEFFIPDMLFSSRAMKAGIEVIEPLLVKEGILPDVTAVIGTVQGDLHDLGKNLVATMWKSANFEVIDLGTNVPPAKFVEAIQQHKARLVGISSLLTTTMPAMKTTVEAVKAAGLEGIKTIVGGAPITESFAHAIGADRYAPDAVRAVDIARELVLA